MDEFLSHSMMTSEAMGESICSMTNHYLSPHSGVQQLTMDMMMDIGIHPVCPSVYGQLIKD